MAEYIDKKSLIGVLKNREDCVDCTDTDCVDCICDFIACIVPSDVLEVRHGKWVLEVKENSCYDYHVTAHCSKCGWEWIGKDSECVGNNKYVFSAFIKGNKEIAKQFAFDNAKQRHLYDYCPNCGARMDLGDDEE